MKRLTPSRPKYQQGPYDISKYPRHVTRPKGHEIEPISATNRSPTPVLVPPSTWRHDRLSPPPPPRWNKPPVQLRSFERGWDEAGWRRLDRDRGDGGAIRIYIRVKLNHIGGWAKPSRPADATHMHKEPIVSSYLLFCNISGNRAIRLIIF